MRNPHNTISFKYLNLLFKKWETYRRFTNTHIWINPRPRKGRGLLQTPWFFLKNWTSFHVIQDGKLPHVIITNNNYWEIWGCRKGRGSPRSFVVGRHSDVIRRWFSTYFGINRKRRPIAINLCNDYRDIGRSVYKLQGGGCNNTPSEDVLH